MNADLQRDGSLCSRPDVTAVRTHASTRHTQQGGIFALLHRHAENAVGTIAGQHVLERHLIHVHVFGTALGQQSLRRVELRLAGFLDGALPEVREVFRHHGRGLQLLRVEGRPAGSLIVLTVHMGRHVDPIESRHLHRTGQFKRTVFQRHAFLDILIHLRSCSIVDGHVIKQRTRLPDLYHELSLLTRFVVPVLMIRLNGYHDTVTTNLC